MDRAVMDCLVSGYEPLIESLSLPDGDDRHVLAAAIVSGADAIVTFNLKDFPTANLKPYNIEVQHPDVFILNQFDLDASKVVIAAQRCRARLKNPPISAEDYLQRLEEQGLPLSVAELRPYAALL